MQRYREEYVSTEYYSNGGGYDSTGDWSTGGQYEQSMMMGGGRKQAEKYHRYGQSEAQSGYGVRERDGWSTGSVDQYGQNTKTSGAKKQADQYYNRYNQPQAQCGYGSSEQYQRKKVNRFGEYGAYNEGSNYEDDISSGQCKQKYTSKVDRYEGGYGGSQAVVARKGGYSAYGGSNGASGGSNYFSKQQNASSGEVEYGEMKQQKMRQQKKSAEKSMTYQIKTMTISSGGCSSTPSSRSKMPGETTATARTTAAATLTEKTPNAATESTTTATEATAMPATLEETEGPIRRLSRMGDDQKYQEAQSLNTIVNKDPV